MTSEFSILAIATVSIAFFHTLSGPDHYLPFIMISKAREWKLRKTILFTAICGLGHVGSSVVLGLIGIAFGIAVGQLELMEGVRGSIVSWIFTSFGLIYMVWGIRQSYRTRRHTHSHFHLGSGLHNHEHDHHKEHIHVHLPVNLALDQHHLHHQHNENDHNHATNKKRNITPWILFTIFIFGPCEPLIPIVMYPAAKDNYTQMLILTMIFSLITILTMITLVAVSYYGFRFLPMKKLERHSHALAGGAIFLCGMGMLFLGL